jgi:hypothetical protein
MLAEVGLSDTLTTGAVTVTAALALFVVSATLVAVTVWVPARDGAVYKPEVLIAPTVEFPPTTVSTDHVTAVLELPCTVAANWIVALTTTLAED